MSFPGPGARLALGLCALALAPRAARAQDGISLELRVERAIERGVAWLVAERKPDGTWPGPEGEHPGGQTALVALTLVKSGMGKGEPPLRDALAALAKVEFASVYSAAVYLMLLDALADKSRTSAAGEGRAAFELLVASQREGVWSYPWGGADMSNTQFALLGLRAGAHLGLEVPDKTLESCVPALFRWQLEDGSFAYDPGKTPTGSVSAATLGGLAVLAELGRGRERVQGALSRRRAEIARAESWVERRFQVDRNPYGERFWTGSWHYAGLWALERWCGLTARTRIGAHEWYREVAGWLVGQQRPGGSWSTPGHSETLDTCFALLTLRRATVSAPFELGDTWKRLDREKQAQAAEPRLVPAEGTRFASDWLVCGPLRDKAGLPQFLDPAALHLDRLHAREHTRLAGAEFERLRLREEGWSNLDLLLKRDAEPGEWVLATTLVWEPDAAAGGALELVLWLTFEDGIKAWLDGRLVLEDLRMQSGIEEHAPLALELAPGAHELVLLLPDERGAAAVGLRLTDRAGRAPPAGLRVQAEPPRGARK